MNTLKLSLASLILAAIFYPFKTIAENYDYSSYYVNDTDLTIDKIQTELSEDGEWIKINPSEIDPESVTDGSDDIDEDVNTDWVWRPYNVEPAWSPYTNGYWKYTNCGWMWVSYYNWGWRTCHYGRWWWSPAYGWVWSPGFVWAPAWVVWFSHPSYYGWYPLPPRACRYNYRRYYCHNIRFRVKHWTFCPTYNFTTIIINNTIIVPPEQNVIIVKEATFEPGVVVEGSRVINNGPEVKIIEESAGQKFTPENVDKFNNISRVTDSKRNDVYSKRDDTKTKEDKRYYNNETRSNEKSRGEEKSRSEDINKNRESKQDKTYESRDYEKRNENKSYESRDYEKKSNDNQKSRNDNSQKQREYKQENQQEKRQEYKREDNNQNRNDDNRSNDNKRSGEKESPPPEKKNDSDNGSRNNDSQKDDNGSRGNGKK